MFFISEIILSLLVITFQCLCMDNSIIILLILIIIGENKTPSPKICNVNGLKGIFGISLPLVNFEFHSDLP